VYDGGALVRKSIKLGKPIIVVAINYRLGLFGFASGPIIREDNKLAGDEGVGNYGLRDQRKALEWLYHFIGDFGGDPSNITLFGQGSGASDIISHLHSIANQKRPLFQRAIVQSALIEHNVPDVATAGWHLSRTMSQLHLSTLAQLRTIDAERLITLGHSLRATDDGVFFRSGWRASVLPQEHPHHVDHLGHARLHPHKHKGRRSRSRSTSTAHAPQHHDPTSTSQPLIIGDCSFDSFLWSLPASLWSSSAVMRRLKAVCGSLSKASALLRAYDISSYTPPDELVERILELINDARIAWPTQVVVDGAQRDGEAKGVWRYTFDQEGHTRGIPHHAADLMYLFDNVPVPAVSQPVVLPSEDSDYFDDDWAIPVVDEFSYGRVRDAIQERWIAFAYGEVPWNEDKVFVFGPEGETGERSSCIFEGRRRKHIWKEALEPLGMQLVQKIGVELSNGPTE
jgi:carboxylesterase type B